MTSPSGLMACGNHEVAVVVHDQAVLGAEDGHRGGLLDDGRASDDMPGRQRRAVEDGCVAGAVDEAHGAASDRLRRSAGGRQAMEFRLLRARDDGGRVIDHFDYLARYVEA